MRYTDPDQNDKINHRQSVNDADQSRVHDPTGTKSNNYGALFVNLIFTPDRVTKATRAIRANSAQRVRRPHKQRHRHCRHYLTLKMLNCRASRHPGKGRDTVQNDSRWQTRNHPCIRGHFANHHNPTFGSISTPNSFLYFLYYWPFLPLSP